MRTRPNFGFYGHFNSCICNEGLNLNGMEEQEDIFVWLKFIQKKSNATQTLTTKKFSCGKNVSQYTIVENITDKLIESLLLNYELHENIKISDFNFKRKFDIELTLNDNQVLLSSLRKSDLITFQFPIREDDELIYEQKLVRVKEFIKVIIGTLIRSVYPEANVSDAEGTETEQLLSKQPDRVILNDYRIYLLLKGLKESEPRNLASHFEKNQNTFTTEDRSNAEKYLTKLKEKYGSDFLIYLTELPEKPFSLKTVNRLFDAISKTKGEIVRLTFDGYNIYEFKLKDNDIVVSCENKIISKIDHEGRVNFISNDSKEKYITATLMLYYGRNQNEELIYFGQQTGTCSFCKKPLEDPISVYWGYGKTCADTFHLPWG